MSQLKVSLTNYRQYSQIAHVRRGMPVQCMAVGYAGIHLGLKNGLLCKTSKPQDFIRELEFEYFMSTLVSS